MTDRIEALVRRARTRLEATRLLRAGARGALWGGAVGLVMLLVQKAWPAVADDARSPWACMVLGTAVGFVVAALRKGIPRAAAALFLDRGLGTQERIVTLVTRDVGVFRERLLRELEPIRSLPRLPFPREAALVPAAMFMLFAAGLLPAAGVTANVATVTTPTTATDTVGEATPDVTAAVARMAAGDAPETADVEDVRKAIDQELHTPEERAAAQAALDRALGGDGVAARDVAKKLDASVGGSAKGDEEARATGVNVGSADGGRATATPYPEARELLLAYRKALAEEMSR